VEAPNQSYQVDLSHRIRQIREALGYTQADIAYRIDISPSAYGQIERRAINATVATLYKIARAMNVSLAFLVDIQNAQVIKKNKL
jgi:transcriptional regulator with XRE-family HTH domain